MTDKNQEARYKQHRMTHERPSSQKKEKKEPLQTPQCNMQLHPKATGSNDSRPGCEYNTQADTGTTQPKDPPPSKKKQSNHSQSTRRVDSCANTTA